MKQKESLKRDIQGSPWEGELDKISEKTGSIMGRGEEGKGGGEHEGMV